MKPLLLVTIVAMVGCGNVAPTLTCVVARVFDGCAESTNNWFSGANPGSCRVEYTNGWRATVPRPVAVGDNLKCCPPTRALVGGACMRDA